MCMLLLGGCAPDYKDQLALPEPDVERFADEVYPILLRDCGMSECHGSSERFFQVLGPGRSRLSSMTGPLEPVTAQELSFSYDRARSMLAQPLEPLLRKPLERAAGGAHHEGVDAFGRNVYASKDDPGYAAIARWARGREDDPK